MGQLCVREAQMNQKNQTNKQGIQRRSSRLQTSGASVIPCETFENLLHEQRHFFSMVVLRKIEKKVKRIQRLQLSGGKLPSQIKQMEASLISYIEQLLNIQEKFQLFEHIYEESEKGYIESEGYSLGFDNSLFYHSQDFKGVSLEKRRFSNAARQCLDKDTLSNNDKNKGNNSPRKERNNSNLRRNTDLERSKEQKINEDKKIQEITQFEGDKAWNQQSDQLEDSQQLSMVISSEIQPQQGIEVFGRIAERLEQPVLVVELHKLSMNTSSMKIAPLYYRLQLEVCFREGEKTQKQIFSTRKITPSSSAQDPMVISEVFEFQSEMDVVESLVSSAKFKVKLFYCLPNKINNTVAVNTSNDNSKSAQSTLCSSTHTTDTENSTKEMKVSSPEIDLKSYLDQNIEYISLDFNTKDESKLKGSLQARFQLAYDQTALVTQVLNRLNSSKTAIQQILAVKTSKQQQ